jgi:hypothetical protein
MDDLRVELAWAVEQCHKMAERLAHALEVDEQPPTKWAYPVGTAEEAPKWYAACVHDMTGRLNDDYAHTGIDLNLDRRPWGDIDRGMPVFAIANGMIVEHHYSQSYLGSIVYWVEHEGDPLYVRSWHLASDALFNSWSAGDVVEAGQPVGVIGNYQLGRGGDHLHLDCALDPFGPHWWFTNHTDVRWVDPVPILKMHLEADVVDAMLRRGDA